MTTILFTFAISLALSLLLTPVARWVGVRFGALDVPSARKVHASTIPRSGGLAIFLSSFLGLFACTLLVTQVSDLLVLEKKIVLAGLGAIIVFAVGFYDDFRRLGPKVKFLVQIVAASIAYYAGIRIDFFTYGGVGFHFGLLSYFVTVFWFLLFINAMNLIDGLDGLAAGVAFFTSLIMVILAVIQNRYLAALEFAALAGALLGFLRYNFNPASIFMGDGGSYFLGYSIAALAILSSVKSQVGATLLIPILALGVPIFDTLLSPVRRFLLGQRMFHPDKGHLHHRLIEMGLSSRKVVLILYGATVVLCLFAIILVNLRDEMSGLLLVILGAGSFITVRKLGYFEYLAADKLIGWFQDISDVAGVSKGRRSFLNLQLEIDGAKNIDELWQKICHALEMMRFDRGEMHVERSVKSEGGSEKEKEREERRKGEGKRDCKECFQFQGVQDDMDVRVWTRGYYRRAVDIPVMNLLKVEFPLSNGAPFSQCSRLVLFKDVKREPLQPYTLRRVENLRRSVTDAMKRLFGS